ncbi:MAG: ATP-binding protein [Oscillospiraceae bacterium]|nr:ATP-binding protein [Oscillospiraceae bacterium]
MVKLIVGVKGTGKTKTLIHLVNEALDNSSGCVVCIEKGQKLKYDVKYKARLIDTAEYEICGADALYGLVCGLYAANYDITHVFIDSALKICAENLDDFACFLNLVDNVSTKNNFQCIITASIAPDGLPEEILKYTG